MKKLNRLYKKAALRNFFMALFLIAAAFAAGCDDTSTDPVNPPGGRTTTTTVSGIVLNEGREPVANATVTVHGNTMQTGAGGEFVFSNITVPAERLFVNVTASGYFNATKAEQPK